MRTRNLKISEFSFCIFASVNFPISRSYCNWQCCLSLWVIVFRIIVEYDSFQGCCSLALSSMEHLGLTNGGRICIYFTWNAQFSHCTNNDPAKIVVTRRLSLLLVPPLFLYVTLTANTRGLDKLFTNIRLTLTNLWANEFYDPIRKCGRLYSTEQASHCRIPLTVPILVVSIHWSVPIVRSEVRHWTLNYLDHII